jgi:predicted nucleic acid-binding protein
MIDTDILLDHVLHGSGPSNLRRAMNAFFCYTTVFNAVEAFAAARSDKEIQAIDDAMSAMKVLGFSAKSSKAVGKIVAGVSGRSLHRKQIAACDNESKEIFRHQTLAGDPCGKTAPPRWQRGMMSTN